MAVQRDSPISFNIKNITGDTMTVTAHPSYPLSNVIIENGIISSPSNQYEFFHNEEMINPLFSLSHLKINDGDTVFFIQKKSTNDISTRVLRGPKRLLSAEQRIGSVDYYDFDPEFEEQLNIPVRAKTRPTITPPKSTCISTEPLPNYFQKSEKQNVEFWNNLEKKFVRK